MIQYLNKEKIDIKKWNRCIASSQCSLPYAYTYYLNIVCKNWGGLVLNHYEAVMPLPYAFKFGLPYIYQPYFTQQLGIFTANNIDNDLIQTFLKNIPKKFVYISTQLNYKCLATQSIKSIKTRKNCILNLNKPYQELFSRFTENTKRNIKQADKNYLQIKINVHSATEYALFYKENNPIEHSKKTNLLLEKIINTTAKNNMGETWSVHSVQGQMLAFAHLLKEKNRIIYIAPATSPEGKKQKAMFLLINELCKKNATHHILLDFEGSEIQNVARFYEGFNAETELYPIYTKKVFSI
ncbi:MAG: hypothetical protein HND27_02490 [Bacteroidetes bacterium]|nr:hypothetical protein [Bacteroidota bacterium]NOG94627.1 hypothetical protein [Bacteroidota bacterium]